MKVEQCILTKQPGTSPRYAVSDRVLLECELVEVLGDHHKKVRLLEAGAGLEVGAEITVSNTKITE